MAERKYNIEKAKHESLRIKEGVFRIYSDALCFPASLWRHNDF
jgi:hypothetical protein